MDPPVSADGQRENWADESNRMDDHLACQEFARVDRHFRLLGRNQIAGIDAADNGLVHGND